MLENMQRIFCKCSLLRFWSPYLIEIYIHLLQLKIYYCITVAQLVQYTVQQTIFSRISLIRTYTTSTHVSNKDHRS
jgi:hypothetical protein